MEQLQSSILNFLIYEENLIFFFISAAFSEGEGQNPARDREKSDKCGYQSYCYRREVGLWCGSSAGAARV